MKTKRVRFSGKTGVPAQVTIPMTEEDWEKDWQSAVVRHDDQSATVAQVTKLPSGHALLKCVGLLKAGDATIEFEESPTGWNIHSAMPPIHLDQLQGNPDWKATITEPGQQRVLHDFVFFVHWDPVLRRQQVRVVASRPDTRVANYPITRLTVGENHEHVLIDNPEIEWIGDRMSFAWWNDPVNYGISLDWLEFLGIDLAVQDLGTNFQAIKDHLANRQHWWEDYPFGHPNNGQGTGMHSAFKPLPEEILLIMQGKPACLPLLMECMKEHATLPYHNCEMDGSIMRAANRPNWKSIHLGSPHFDGGDFLKPFTDRNDYEANYTPNRRGKSPEDRAHIASHMLQWVALLAWSPHWVDELEFRLEATLAMTHMGIGEERGGGRYLTEVGNIGRLLRVDSPVEPLTNRISRALDDMEAANFGPIDIKRADPKWDPNNPTHQSWQGLIYCYGLWTILSTKDWPGDLRHPKRTAEAYSHWLMDNAVRTNPDGTHNLVYFAPVDSPKPPANFLPRDQGKWSWGGSWEQAMGGVWVAAQSGHKLAQQIIAEWDRDRPVDAAVWIPAGRPWLSAPVPPPSTDITLTRGEADLLINDAQNIIDTLRSRMGG